jgi:hypothetical protein
MTQEYIPCTNPFKVDTSVITTSMSCVKILNFSKLEIESSFGVSLNNIWKLSTYILKDMMIIYNPIINACLLFANSDIEKDDISNISEFIDADIYEPIECENESECECELTSDSDSDSDFESDQEDVPTTKLIQKHLYNF